MEGKKGKKRKKRKKRKELRIRREPRNLQARPEDSIFAFYYVLKPSNTLKMSSLPLLLASGMSGIDVLAFSLVKKISEKALLPGFTLLSMGLYALQPLILLQALPFENVAVMNILWNLISSIVVTLVSIFLLGEKIGVYKLMGVLIGIVSLFLCTFEDGSSEIQKYLPAFMK